jgi:hypothetical protein
MNMEEKSPDKPDLNNIYRLLGDIKSSVSSLDKTNSRTTLALIGVIAAQIGVKVLGTPILLDIATIIGIVGIFLLLGVIMLGIRRVRHEDEKITGTGIGLIVMISSILLTQVLVYLRDLGILGVDVIYVVRIWQNISIFYFAWKMLSRPEIFCKKESKQENNG